MTAIGPTSRVYFSQRMRLHYVDWGNPTAPPLLLVHGGRDHCRNWDWVAEGLRDEYHIIAPDLPGFGKSEMLPRGGTFDRIAETIDRFTEVVGFNRYAAYGLPRRRCRSAR